MASGGGGAPQNYYIAGSAVSPLHARAGLMVKFFNGQTGLAPLGVHYYEVELVTREFVMSLLSIVRGIFSLSSFWEIFDGL